MFTGRHQPVISFNKYFHIFNLINHMEGIIQSFAVKRKTGSDYNLNWDGAGLVVAGVILEKVLWTLFKNFR